MPLSTRLTFPADAPQSYVYWKSMPCGLGWPCLHWRYSHELLSAAAALQSSGYRPHRLHEVGCSCCHGGSSRWHLRRKRRRRMMIVVQITEENLCYPEWLRIGRNLLLSSNSLNTNIRVNRETMEKHFLHHFPPKNEADSVNFLVSGSFLGKHYVKNIFPFLFLFTPVHPSYAINKCRKKSN